MYNVLIVLDESRNKSYYYSYVAENGNIECTELPPYQDINKAQACYWDGKKWVYDAEKYAEIVAIRTAEKEAAETEATPSNADLAAALMEIAENISLIMDAVTELANEISVKK